MRVYKYLPVDVYLKVLKKLTELLDRPKTSNKEEGVELEDLQLQHRDHGRLDDYIIIV